MTRKMHPTVLLVDDDFAVATMYLLGLEHAGLSVMTAGSAKAALAAIAYEIPQVMVVDWNMPGMRGDELLAILRTEPRTAELPVLFLSAFAPDEARPLAYVGNDRAEWLMKTRTTPAQLARYVVDALDRHLLEAKPKAIA